MPGEFYKRQEYMESLHTAAAVGGPHDGQPPYARAAFPVIALPRVLQQFVTDATQAMGVMPESIATPAIAVCATAIGNTCRIRINPVWSEPAVIWAVTLMESGSLKTPAYNAAFEPLRAAQRLREENLAGDQAAYKQAKLQHEADLDAWRARSQVEPNAQPPAEPQEPKAVDYYTSDSTVEALAMLFATNPRGLAITRDELSGFFGSFGAYKGGRGADESAYLEFYNAGSVKLNRASGKRIYVHNAALSIFGTCQPSVFLQSVGATGAKGNQVDNGLAARFLIASPENRAKSWRDPKPYNTRHYHAMVGELLSIPLSTDNEGRIVPAMIAMHADATERFKTFVNEHGKQTSGISNPALRYHYAKLEAVAARLALIFYLCDAATQDIGEGEGGQQGGIQERHVLSGIALARWYGREACRVYEGYESAADREKKELLDEIKDHGGSISPRAMGRLRRRWADPLAAELALRNLARAGYGELVCEETGGRPSIKFKLYDQPRLPHDVVQSAVSGEFLDLPSTPQYDV